MKTQNVSEIRDRLCQHYRQIGLSKHESARYSAMISKWITHSGPEWTVNRLKQLMSTWKSSIASDSHYEVPEGWAKRVNRHGISIFKDKLIHDLMSRDPSSERNMKIVQGFLRSYQVITLESLSAKQYEKFSKAVTTPMTFAQKVHTQALGVRVAETCKHLFADFPDFTVRVTPLSHMSVSSTKRSPVIHEIDKALFDSDYQKLTLRTAPRICIETKDVFNVLGIDSKWKSFWDQHPAHVSDCIVGDQFDLPIVHTNVGDVDLPVGTIGFIQEGGAKLRAVANPFLAVQALAEPLKNKLEFLTSHMRNVYTFDQEAGREKIAAALSAGKTVYSFDASSFTDRFPYDLQRQVLLQLEELDLVTKSDIDLFDTVVSKSWQLTLDGGKRVQLRYEAGQPQGFGPSFHLACLTHALVALSARTPGVSDSFAVVGDDIAIWDKDVASYYHDQMTNMGVEINMAKSMISPTYAEFCGKVIDKMGTTPSMKVKFLQSDDQIVTSLSFYGAKGLKYLTPAETRLAVKALLPVDLGGLGTQFDLATYSEYLKVLKTENIQSHRLRKQLQELLNPVSQRTMEASLSHISEFYNSLDLRLSSTEWEKLNQNVAALSCPRVISDWSGFPVNPRDHEQEVHDLHSHVGDIARLSNTFRDVWDNAIRADFENVTHKYGDQGLNLAHNSPEARERLREISNAVCTRFGYLENISTSRPAPQYVCGESVDEAQRLKDSALGEENSSKRRLRKSQRNTMKYIDGDSLKSAFGSSWSLNSNKDSNDTAEERFRRSCGKENRVTGSKPKGP